MPKIFATADKKKASEMLLEGAKPKAVAAAFGVHVSSVYNLRQEMGHGHSKADRASHTVVLRLSDDEFQALSAFVVDGGYKNRTAALRSLIRSATGFLELKRSEFADLTDIRNELKAQGSNLNQLSRALNRSAFNGGAHLTRADKTFLSEVKRAHTAVDGAVSRIFREVRQKGRDALHTSDKL